MDDAFAIVQRKLAALHGETLINAQKTALKAVGKMVKAELIALAPMRTDDLPSKTALAPGAVKQNIRALVKMKDSYSSPILIVGPTKKVKHVVRWMEEGHDQVVGGKKDKGGKIVKFIAARPFVRVVRDTMGPEVAKLFISTLQQELDKALKS